MNNPISSYKDYEEYMLEAKMCPECEYALTEVCQPNGPDDYDITGLHCENCGYQYDF